jgi:hypothetical protein
LLSVLLLAACSVGGPESPPDGRRLEREAIEAIWRFNEALVERGISAYEGAYAGSLEGFPEAVKFFEDLTGIQSSTMTFAGRVPVPGLRDTVAQWRSWYDQHRDELRLDPGSCQLTLQTNR